MTVARYAHPRINPIWGRGEEFSIWLEIWVRVVQASVKTGKVSNDDALDTASALWSVIQQPHEAERLARRADELEDTVTRHNIIAATRTLSEEFGEAVSRSVHRGMTSADIMDTAFAVQLHRAASHVEAELNEVIIALWHKAIMHRHVIMLGRTHGMDAELTTLGLWFLRHADAFNRELTRLEEAIEEARVGKISGAVGTYDLLPPEVEKEVLDSLGLKPAGVTSQIIGRSHFLPVFTSLASIMACVKAFAEDLRWRASSGIAEVQEKFVYGKQKGSSAMPHKRNPIKSENLIGLADTAMPMLMTALLDVRSTLERDISHSSAERHIAPDMTCITGFALRRLRDVVEELEVHEERIKANLNRTPWWTGRLMEHLIAEHGWTREDAYDAVQTVALQVINGVHPNMDVAIAHHKALNHAVGRGQAKHLREPDLDEKNIKMIFERVRETFPEPIRSLFQVAEMS